MIHSQTLKVSSDPVEKSLAELQDNFQKQLDGMKREAELNKRQKKKVSSKVRAGLRTSFVDFEMTNYLVATKNHRKLANYEEIYKEIQRLLNLSVFIYNSQHFLMNILCMNRKRVRK